MKFRARGDYPKVRVSDLFGEAVAGISDRPGRTALTSLGTIAGIAALVATVGISRTAGAQIVSRFDALAATYVVAEPQQNFGGALNTAASTIPWNAEQRMALLNGVIAAGTLSDVNVNNALVRSVAVRDPQEPTEFQTSVKAVSPGLFAAIRTELRTGRVFDSTLDEADVALLGRVTADELGITRVSQRPVVFVGDQPFEVIGIVESVARESALLDAVIIPNGTAKRLYKLAAPTSVRIATAIGAAKLIARQAPLQLDPVNPDRISVTSDGEPTNVRNAVQNDLDSLFLALGGLILIVGAVGIANITLVSVIERTPEIGLRRAMGASRAHIATQFLTESALTGLIGGSIGAAVGTSAIIIVAWMKKWTPVLPPTLPIFATFGGAAIGLLAGTYPARRATKLQPIEALR